jgi:hypothetical protein
MFSFSSLEKTQRKVWQFFVKCFDDAIAVQLHQQDQVQNSRVTDGNSINPTNRTAATSVRDKWAPMPFPQVLDAWKHFRTL